MKGDEEVAVWPVRAQALVPAGFSGATLASAAAEVDAWAQAALQG